MTFSRFANEGRSGTSAAALSSLAGQTRDLIDGLSAVITGESVCDPSTQYTYTATTTLASPTYQWYYAGAAISGQTSATYQRTVDWLDHDRDLYCVITSSGVSYKSNSIVFQVGIAPVITAWDRYVSTAGSDSNDGLTPATAWATFAPLATYMDSDSRSGQTVTVRVATGTYETSYTLSRSYTSPPTLIFDVADDVIIERGGQLSESCFYAKQNLRMQVVCRATGDSRLLVRGFSSGEGNAYGFANTADLKCWGVRATDCLDGFTGHQTSTGWLVDSEIYNNRKGGVIHSNTITSAVIARCSITGRTDATGGVLTAVGNNRFIDCDIIPVKLNEGIPTAGAVFDRCRIGGTNASYSFVNVDMETVGTTHTFNDCYLRMRGDIAGVVNMTRCYGLFTARVRGATNNPRSTFDSCVFVGAGAGAWANSLFAGGYSLGVSPITIKNSIIANYTGTAIGNNFSAQEITDWNSVCLIQNCLFYNNTTAVLAGISGTATGTVTSNPLLGAANTAVQTDYTVATNSPAVGAGVGGANIGFVLSQLPLVKTLSDDRLLTYREAVQLFALATS